VEKQRKEMLPSLRETSEVLSTYTQWSPVLASLGAIVPQEVVVTELMARRQNIPIESEKVDHRYSLMIGFIAGYEPVAVERFMQSLRISLEAQLKVSNIRIVSQKRQEIRNRTFQYYIVECVMKP
jgi:Tfp pilus assembly protein PilN